MPWQLVAGVRRYDTALAVCDPWRGNLRGLRRLRWLAGLRWLRDLRRARGVWRLPRLRLRRRPRSGAGDFAPAPGQCDAASAPDPHRAALAPCPPSRMVRAGAAARLGGWAVVVHSHRGSGRARTAARRRDRRADRGRRARRDRAAPAVRRPRRVAAGVRHWPRPGSGGAGQAERRGRGRADPAGRARAAGDLDFAAMRSRRKPGCEARVSTR